MVSALVNANASQANGTIPPGANTANVEIYNGTSWTEVANVVVSRNGHSSAGTTTAGLTMGGSSPTAVVATTEEWTAPTESTVTFDATNV